MPRPEASRSGRPSASRPICATGTRISSLGTWRDPDTLSHSARLPCRRSSAASAPRFACWGCTVRGERGEGWRELKHGRGADRASTPPSTRRRRTGGARRAATKRSVLRRVGRIVWVSPRHAALALAAGIVCGALVSRVGGMISPPYAAILGTLVGYPALVTLWRRLPRPGRRGR